MVTPAPARRGGHAGGEPCRTASPSSRVAVVTPRAGAAQRHFGCRGGPWRPAPHRARLPPSPDAGGSSLSGELTVMHAGTQPSGDAERRWEPLPHRVPGASPPPLAKPGVGPPPLRRPQAGSADGGGQRAPRRRHAPAGGDPPPGLPPGGPPSRPLHHQVLHGEEERLLRQGAGGAHPGRQALRRPPRHDPLRPLLQQGRLRPAGPQGPGRHLGLRRLAAGRRAPDAHRRGRGRRSAHAVRSGDAHLVGDPLPGQQGDRALRRRGGDQAPRSVVGDPRPAGDDRRLQVAGRPVVPLRLRPAPGGRRRSRLPPPRSR